MNKEMNTYVM